MLLEVRGLSHAFAGRPRGIFGRRGPALAALSDVSFTIERGEAFGLVGESGSGKSTVARVVAGLLCPSAGEVRFDGREIWGTEISRLGTRERRALARRIQLVFQDPGSAFDPRLPLGTSVAEPLASFGVGTRRERRLIVGRLLESVGLPPELAARYPHELSGGQKQRGAIARALALEPELLVLDEPVSALDVSVQAGIVNLLAELCRGRRMSYLFIAHDLAVVRHLCRRVAVMYLGRIVEEGASEALFAAPQHPYTRALLAAVPIADPARERARARAPLAGDPPSPYAPPSGCAFHPRCALRASVPGERCSRERPELVARPTGPTGTRAACHLGA